MKFDFGKILFLAIFLSIFGLGFVVWPIFVFGLIFSVLTEGKSQKTVSRKTDHKNTEEARKLQQQTAVLNDYFKTHAVLTLEHGLSLRVENKEFRSVDELMLYLDDDQIGTMKEFKKTYPSTYEDLIEQCALASKTPQTAPVYEKKKEVHSEIEDFIEALNNKNIEIEHEEISNGLYEACAYLRQIDLIVKQFPESKDKTRKLTQYYLPILLDILRSYQQLDRSARNHEEFQKTQDRLLKTLLLINEALKSITTSLTQEYFMDLSADMSTLEALLKKDGLVSEGTMKAARKQVKAHE